MECFDRFSCSDQSPFEFEDLQYDPEDLKTLEEKNLFYMICFPLQMLMTWVFRVICLTRSLRFRDLPKLSPEYRATAYVRRFETVWRFFRWRWMRKLRLLSTLYVCFGVEYMFSGLLKLVSTVLSVVFPLLLKKFLQGFNPLLSDSEIRKLKGYQEILPPDIRPSGSFADLGFRENNYEIWLWLLALAVAQSLNFIIQVYSYYVAAKVGTKMNVLLTNRIYRKIFSTGKKSRADKKVILTYLAFDTDIIDEGHHQLHEVWTAVVQVAFSMYFMIDLMGYISLSSYAAFFAIIVFMFLLLACILLSRSKLLKHLDTRLRNTKEVLQNSIIVKFFNLQKYYLRRIFSSRKKEIQNYRIMFFFRAIVNALAYTTPPLMIMLSFLFYFVQNQQYDNLKLLISISYYKMLQSPLGGISINLTRYMHSLAAMGRVQAFLELPDEIGTMVPKPKDPSVAIEIKNGHFAWPTKEAEDEDGSGFSINGINLSVKKGSIVMIVGNTRSGKTTLLKSILGETECDENTELCIDGNFSFCDQEVFLENDTILHNIIQGDPYDKRKLDEVLEVCGLTHDIDSFHSGINLQVGDGSITLSSGQKSRIALARACYYSKGDIFMLDNSLGTLDSFVSNFVFQYCLLRYLKGKTIVLVTNKAELLCYADEILFMKNGEISERGSYTELIARNGDFRKFVGSHVFEKVVDDDRFNLQHLLEEVHGRGEDDMKSSFTLQKGKKVVENEERRKGLLSIKTFQSFIHHTSYCMKGKCFWGLLIIILMSLLYLITVLCYFSVELHVSNIAKKSIYMAIHGNEFTATFVEVGNESESANAYFAVPAKYPHAIDSWCPYSNESWDFVRCGTEVVEVYWMDYRNGTLLKNGLGATSSLSIYLGLVIVLFCVLFCASYCCFFNYVNTSNRMYEAVMQKLISARMSFFYANPIGRVLNRVSHDVVRMDYDLLVRGDFLIIISLLVIGSIFMVIYSSNGILLPIVLVSAGMLTVIYAFFRKANMDLKRMDSITKSKIFHHFNQTLNGLSTITSFGYQARFQKNCDRHIDVHNRSSFFLIATKYALRMYLTLFGVLNVVLASVMVIPISYYGRNVSDAFASYMQLGLTNLVTTVDVFGIVFFNLVIWEIEMNSVERLDYYLRNVKSEESDSDGRKQIAISKGKVEFKDFSLRYKEDFPLVLSKLNFTVKAGEKCVIIGRTGCGKTTVLMSICQILRGCGGSILIDESNISKCSLQSLRSQISVVPADPILFSGTLRSNLDPHGEYTDSKILEIMKMCHLTEFISTEDKKGLDVAIEENGHNFSIGERRLISLCRGVLRNPRIILLDECTSIDYHMDELIQEIVISLPETTVFSISHRLNNIRFYEKVLVLSDGKVQEFGKPKELVDSKESFLRQLIEMIPNRDELLALFAE